MTETEQPEPLGAYLDGRRYPLPAHWEPVHLSILQAAHDRALGALAGADAEKRLAQYFNPDGNYSGALLNTLSDPAPPPDDPSGDHTITAADLLSVTTLSMELDASHVRRLMTPGHYRHSAHRYLMGIPSGLPIQALDAPDQDGRAILNAAEDFYSLIRSGSGDGGKWVTASKLLARKRPDLMPVRDNVVCTFLAGAPLRRGGIGTFIVDMQVFAYVMSDQAVTSRLHDLWRLLHTRYGSVIDERITLLRLLDVALWMAGQSEARIDH